MCVTLKELPQPSETHRTPPVAIRAAGGYLGLPMSAFDTPEKRNTATLADAASFNSIAGFDGRNADDMGGSGIIRVGLHLHFAGRGPMREHQQDMH